MDKLLSFIVPVYNVERYVEACMESLQAQRGDDIEFVLVDDGSRDQSGALLDAFAAREPRARVIHKPNGGVSAARNDGMDAARGRWLCFVDSDDLLGAGLVGRARPFLTEENDAVCFSWSGFERDDARDYADDRPAGTHACDPDELRLLCRSALYPAETLSGTPLGFRGNRGVWGLMLRADIIGENGLRFAPDMRLAEDVAFRLAYLSRCRSAVCLSEAMYGHRVLRQSLLHGYRPEIEADVLRALSALRKVVAQDYADAPDMLARYACAAVLESRWYLERYLAHPDCPLTREEKIARYDAFRNREALAEAVRACDRGLCRPPCDALLDAYRSPDAALSFERAVGALQTGRESALKALLKRTGLVAALRRIARR